MEVGEIGRPVPEPAIGRRLRGQVADGDGLRGVALPQRGRIGVDPAFEHPDPGALEIKGTFVVPRKMPHLGIWQGHMAQLHVGIGLAPGGAKRVGGLVSGPEISVVQRLRVFIPLGLTISAVVNLIMGNNTIAVVAVALWAMNGWFQGVGAPASVVSITQWFSIKERGTTYGLWSTAHSIGEGLTYFGTATVVSLTV